MAGMTAQCSIAALQQSKQQRQVAEVRMRATSMATVAKCQQPTTVTLQQSGCTIVSLRTSASTVGPICPSTLKHCGTSCAVPIFSTAEVCTDRDLCPEGPCVWTFAVLHGAAILLPASKCTLVTACCIISATRYSQQRQSST